MMIYRDRELIHIINMIISLFSHNMCVGDIFGISEDDDDDDDL